MEDNINKWYHEQAMARMERTNKRLWILCIILLVALALSNAGWMYYENQFEDTVVEQEVDTGEGGATVTGTGDINYGESKTDSTETDP